MSRPDRHDELLLERLRLDDRAGPARRITKDQALALVDEALSTWEGERLVPERRGAGLWQTFAVAAGLLLAVVGGASAARWYYGAVELASARAEGARGSHKRRAVAPASAVPPEQEAQVDVESPEPRAAKVARPVERAEPDDLLQKANHLRAEGRFQAAAETYAQVYERYPRSLSAYAAQVAAASIELEHLGKPLRAQKLFESALHAYPKGALDLEARQGLSLSLHDLGKRKEEIRVLRSLIAAHAASPAARRAEARLKELAGIEP